MIRNNLLLFFLLPFYLSTYGQDIFISRICFPTNNNSTYDRFLEIYNPTENPVDLSSWYIEGVANNTNKGTFWSLSGNIQPGETLICAKDNSSEENTQTISPDFVTAASFYQWNGGDGDGAILYNSSSTKIDEIILTSSSTGKQMKRNLNISSPNSTYTPGEWTSVSVSNALDVFPGFRGTVLSKYTNWSSSGWDMGAPDANTDVGIPNRGTIIKFDTDTLSAKSVTIAPGGMLTVNTARSLAIAEDLTIQSTNNHLTGSFTLSGTGTVAINGTLNVERYMDGENWHTCSAPVANQDIKDFLTNAGNNISAKEIASVLNYACSYYEEGTNSWSNYYTENMLSTDFTSGKLYLVRRNDSGSVCFSGDYNTNDVAVSLSKSESGSGWNGLGNPFTCPINAIRAETEASLYKTLLNSGIIEPNTGIYIYNTDHYEIFNYATGDLNLPIGQGFLVKAGYDGAIATLTTDFLVQGTSPSFKSIQSEFEYFDINATFESGTELTKLAFRSDMNIGIDEGYDAIHFGSSETKLYTKLADGTNGNYGIQALPLNQSEIRVGLEVEGSPNQTVQLRPNSTYQISDYSVNLVDKQLNTESEFHSINDEYSFNLDENGKTSNRFELVFRNSVATSDIEINRPKPFVAYLYNSRLYLKNYTESSGSITIYNAMGKKVMSDIPFVPKLGIPIEKLATGSYIISIHNTTNHQVCKVFIPKR